MRLNKQYGHLGLIFLLVSLLLLLLMPKTSVAESETDCQSVTLAAPNWSDIEATNAVLSTLLNALGYQTKEYLLTVPLVYKSLKIGKVDVFLGNWMPAQQAIRHRYRRDIEIVGQNLSQVRFTLAVPDYVYQHGVMDVADLHTYAALFKSRIYGIESGAPVNQNLRQMLKDKTLKLTDWSVVETSEQDMMAQVAAAIQRRAFVVFIAWEPHPMNVRFALRYLSGGSAYLGDNYGSSTVYTITRKGFAQACPNLRRLLDNLQFTVPMENEIMEDSLDRTQKIEQVAKAWVQSHPELLKVWLKDVTTVNGQPGLPKVKANLKIE